MDAGSFSACAGDPLWLARAADQPEDRWNDDGGHYESPVNDASRQLGSNGQPESPRLPVPLTRRSS
jgi:hypothetical protein